MTFKVGDEFKWSRKVETFSGILRQEMNCVIRFIYPSGALLLELPEYLGPNLRFHVLQPRKSS